MRINNLSLRKKACIYMSLMGVVGAVAGFVDTKVSLDQCLDSEECLVSNPAQQQVYRMSVGAVAGVVAASMLSLPSLLNED